MAKPVKFNWSAFSSKPAKRKAAGTGFNFGANTATPKKKGKGGTGGGS